MVSIIIQDKWLLFWIESIVHFQNNSAISLSMLNPLLCSWQFQAISRQTDGRQFFWFAGAFNGT